MKTTKIFVVGLPGSGRTSVSKSIMRHRAAGYHYIDAMGWLKSSFRERRHKESAVYYEEAYHNFLSVRRTINPDVVVSNVKDLLQTYTGSHNIVVIDGISSPYDFAQLFDYRQDIVVFLNRTNNPTEFRDHESIGISVMRDYCFWMSSAGLIKKERWLEYNFQIPGEASDQVKMLGSKNSVFIVKSLERATQHLLDRLAELGV